MKIAFVCFIGIIGWATPSLGQEIIINSYDRVVEVDICDDYQRFVKHSGETSMCLAEKKSEHWSWGYAVRIPCALWEECRKKSLVVEEPIIVIR